MLSIVFIRILFYIFFLTFFGGGIYMKIKNRKEGMWSLKKALFVIFFMLMSFFLMVYFSFIESSRLIKYHLKNQTYSEVCGVIEGFYFFESRGHNEKSKPTILKLKEYTGVLHDYSTNHFYSYENFDKYKEGDKICIKYFIQFQHIYFHLPSDREILYITKPNSTVYDNHISLTDEYEEFRDEQP